MKINFLVRNLYQQFTFFENFIIKYRSNDTQYSVRVLCIRVSFSGDDHYVFALIDDLNQAVDLVIGRPKR